MLRLIILVCFSILLWKNSLVAQFNFQVGYNFNWSELTRTNEIIDSYNFLHPDINTSMKNIHGLHGIHLGIRHSFDIISIVGSWSNQINNIYSIQSNPIAGAIDIKKQIYFRNNIYSLGLETSTGVFSIGSTMDFRNLTIKSKETGMDEKMEVLQTNNWGSTLYSQLDFAVSSRMALIIRINYSFPWKSIDLNNLYSYLGSRTSNVSREKFNQFGIALIFSNGKQPRY